MVAAGFHLLSLVVFFLLARIGWAMAHDSGAIYGRFGDWMILPQNWAVQFIRVAGWCWVIVFGVGIVSCICLIPIDIYRSVASH